jgi:hypothetical protein
MWRWQPSEIERRVVLLKYTDVWDVRPASIISAIALMMTINIIQRDYTALYSRRLSSSYSPPWDPEISYLTLCSRKNTACLSCGFLRLVVPLKLTDYLELLTASIVRAIVVVSTCETSVSFYETAPCNVTEDSQLNTRRYKNLKSLVDLMFVLGYSIVLFLLHGNMYFNIVSVNFFCTVFFRAVDKI